MRLLSLEVKGTACFRNPIRLAEFDPGINIIYGPNECGKSTLITCLARAFFDKSNTRAQEVESLRPEEDASPKSLLSITTARTPLQGNTTDRVTMTARNTAASSSGSEAG